MEAKYFLAVKNYSQRKAYNQENEFKFFIPDGYPKEDSLPNGIYLGTLKKIITDRYDNEIPILKLTKFAEIDTEDNYELALSLYDILPRKKEAFEQIIKVLDSFYLAYTNFSEATVKEILKHLALNYGFWLDFAPSQTIIEKLKEYDEEINFERFNIIGEKIPDDLLEYLKKEKVKAKLIIGDSVKIEELKKQIIELIEAKKLVAIKRKFLDFNQPIENQIIFFMTEDQKEKLNIKRQ